MKFFLMILLSLCLSFILSSCGQSNGIAPSTSTAATPATTQSCGGVLVGGYCWYLSQNAGNCTTTCASHGGYDSATASYAGSTSGSNAQCTAVLQALGYAGAAAGDGNCTLGLGCMVYDTNLYLRCVDVATNASDSLSDTVRACACFQ